LFWGILQTTVKDDNRECLCRWNREAHDKKMSRLFNRCFTRRFM